MLRSHFAVLASLVVAIACVTGCSSASSSGGLEGVPNAGSSGIGGAGGKLSGTGNRPGAGGGSNLGGGGNATGDGGDQPSDAGEQPQSPDAASSFGCTGAGIAAFADQLVNEGRKSCTSDGLGVVTDTNYDCMQGPINDLAPFSSAAYAALEYWAQNGDNFSGKMTLFPCVDFAFVVTAGVCGQPINGGDAQIDGDMQIPGYTYVSATQGGAQAGDVLVYDGHIAITAQVIDGNHTRIAEANYLNADGSLNGMDDTGVISNTRVDTVDDAWIIGWYRKL